MKCTLMLCIVLIITVSTGLFAQNLLKNPGFEDPAGWSANWTVKDANGGNLTYHYRLTSQGGGHGNACPRTGANALEIYSTDRQTYLTQKVVLEPGTYRLSAWARLNNTPDYSPIEIKLGDKSVTVPLASDGYRQLWADFVIDKAGEYEASFKSCSYGVAVDDLSLEKINDANDDSAPVMHIDLYPSTSDRAKGIQYCLKDSYQWVNFAVTCMSPSKVKKPVMRVLACEPVKLSGLNESLIHHYRMREEEQIEVRSESVVRDGRKYQQFSFTLPRFVFGIDHPMYFGGCWVSNVPAKNGRLIIEIVEGDDMLASETVILSPIIQPKEFRTPQKYYVLGYAIQNWMQNKDERIKALPAQFKMIGMNVWSDYGLVAEKPKDGLTDEELVLKEAYEKYGIRRFWPNFSCMIETSGGGVYSDASENVGDEDMYIVSADGKVDKKHYNFNYAANKGRAWMESVVSPWVRTLNRPIEKGLPFRYTGFVNDGLEGIAYSYDPSTLAAFASFKGVDVGQVTPEKLNGEWKRDWLLFNMDLYTRLVDVWSGEIKKAYQDVKIVNTASTYGPGSFGDLTPQEQMKWTRSVDYNMPQWYASSYYGSAYFDQLKQGEAENVFGKQNGGTDLIPLLYLSMGGMLEDPEAIRFKILDLCSSSKSVKGIGYYIGTYIFTDAKLMVGLSKVHTLLADIEDYYADGVRDDKLVKLKPVADDAGLIPGMDLEGKQVMLKPESSTEARVHRLNKDGRIALITVITHSEQRVGGKVALDIDTKSLPNGGKDLVLIDHLTGQRSPFTSRLTVDTDKTKNIAVYEIAER